MSKGKQMLYTQQGYQELVDELHYLKHEKREKIKNDIAVARSFGDLSENAEYDEARNEQAKNETRIKELEELLENAVILDENKKIAAWTVVRTGARSGHSAEKALEEVLAKAGLLRDDLAQIVATGYG
ncbi:MAG: transcription elongation factor GreA, partial [Clostridia bacterium]|nr:transcription elongation factor GreA [Clostridia bacterium]